LASVGSSVPEELTTHGLQTFAQRRIRLAEKVQKGGVYPYQSLTAIKILEAQVELKIQSRRAGQIDAGVHAAVFTERPGQNE
jgi:hypothetical protein